MFRFNRKFYISINLIVTFITFYLIFYIRYSSGIFPKVSPKILTNVHIAMFLSYSVLITILNVAMKLYELKRVTAISESFINGIIVSVITAFIFGFIFYITKLDFARFVLFTGLLINPFIISIVNSLSFRAFFPKSKVYNIYYIGSEKNYKLLTNLTEQYRKIINTNIIKTDSLPFCDNIKIANINIVIDNDFVLSDELSLQLHDFELNGGYIYSLLDLFEYLDESLPSELINKIHFQTFSTYRINNFYSQYVKRIGDILISVILLAITSPIIIITALIIKLTSKGNVFYKQKRSGLNGKEFFMYKFRTMSINAENGKAKLTVQNDPRITSIGKLIRPIRIDELPQLINILKGEMSFIGPRPERQEFIEEIIKIYPLFKKRLLVKPGLTGWAQVKYQYVSTLEDMNKKLSYDLYYINNMSFSLDIKILLYTVETILFKRGAL